MEGDLLSEEGSGVQESFSVDPIVRLQNWSTTGRDSPSTSAVPQIAETYLRGQKTLTFRKDRRHHMASQPDRGQKGIETAQKPKSRGDQRPQSVREWSGRVRWPISCMGQGSGRGQRTSEGHCSGRGQGASEGHGSERGPRTSEGQNLEGYRPGEDRWECQRWSASSGSRCPWSREQ